MSITDFQSLKSEIGKWLLREDDADIDDRASLFVSLAEARIRRNQEWFTQLYSLTNAGLPLDCTANPTQLPANVKQVLDMWASTGSWNHPIEILPPSAWRDLAATNRDANGIPTKAVIIPEMDHWMGADTGTDDATSGPKLYLWPQPSDTSQGPFQIDFKYIRDVEPLANNTDTNGLLRRHPDLYLYAALVESSAFYQHDDRLQMWEQRYQQAVSEINIERDRAEFGASAKRTRLPRSFG